MHLFFFERGCDACTTKCQPSQIFSKLKKKHTTVSRLLESSKIVMPIASVEQNVNCPFCSETFDDTEESWVQLQQCCHQKVHKKCQQFYMQHRYQWNCALCRKELQY